ncbi:MAG: DoxX family membrane protein [Calditrichaeota bacterium]|nr:DoxX family membrane protein [Calditrichota bacterium]RQW00004.1 MAG: DoxX family membrane protein [Calditrichota bacterium]
MKKKEIFVLILRLFFGCLFLYSSYFKLTEPLDFAETIENYQVFGSWLSHWGAILIPASELILGILLLTGIWIRESFTASLLIFIAFDIMIVQAAIRGLDISCGCFNPSENGPIDALKILENGLLTVMNVAAVVLTRPAPEGNMQQLESG